MIIIVKFYSEQLWLPFADHPRWDFLIPGAHPRYTKVTLFFIIIIFRNIIIIIIINITINATYYYDSTSQPSQVPMPRTVPGWKMGETVYQVISNVNINSGSVWKSHLVFQLCRKMNISEALFGRLAMWVQAAEPLPGTLRQKWLPGARSGRFSNILKRSWEMCLLWTNWLL